MFSRIEPSDPQKNCSPPIEWVESLGCWCIYDVRCITVILKSTNFSIVDYKEVYQSFKQRIGMDCPTLIHALGHIPLANEGKIHAELRRDMARLMRTEISAAKEHLATLIPTILAKVCQDCARVDLVQDVVQPIADTFFACLLGVNIPARSRSDISVSQVFDRSLSLNRRKAISIQADEIRAGFAAETRKLKTSPDYALALTIIGHDSIVAS